MTDNIKKKVEPKVKYEAPKVEQYIYIGDTLGFDLIKDTVYVGGMPKAFKEKADIHPEIKALMVPIDKMVEAKKRLKEPGTIEFLANVAIKGVK